MAARYWVGGSGTWTATNTSNWSLTSGGAGGAPVPTGIDTAVFDLVGAGSGIITLAFNTAVTSLILRSGTLFLDVYQINAASFSASTTTSPYTYRTIDFGTAGVLRVYGAGPSVFNASGSTNLIVKNAATGRIEMSASSAKTFFGGGLTWPGISNQSGGPLTIKNSNTFASYFSSTVPASYIFEAGSTQTFTSSLAFAGTSTSGITIRSTVDGSQATLSQAAGLGLTATYIDVRDSNVIGGQTWRATSSFDAGNNTGWLFPAEGKMFVFF